MPQDGAFFFEFFFHIICIFRIYVVYCSILTNKQHKNMENLKLENVKQIVKGRTDGSKRPKILTANLDRLFAKILRNNPVFKGVNQAGSAVYYTIIGKSEYTVFVTA